jgi:hypothetical protein
MRLLRPTGARNDKEKMARNDIPFAFILNEVKNLPKTDLP